MKKPSGLTIVMMAATLSGCSGTSKLNKAVSAGGKVELGHCYSKNICKGHNDCKTAKNACAGHASCKGTGFVALPVKSCNDIGGKVKDAWRGTANTSDLIHCSGVNICKGHNDCKTAKNACAGQASCKGTGFVMASKKACADIGGKIDS